MENASNHFKWREFYCPTAKHLIVSDLTLHHIEKLEQLRVLWDAPIKINSGYRSPEHNKKVGGVEKSMHMLFATDITPVTSGPHPDLRGALQSLHGLAEEVGFGGIGQYNTFLHLDCRDFIGRSSARWDNRS